MVKIKLALSVSLMANVNFYTHGTVLGNVAQKTGASASLELKTAVEGLAEHKVTRSNEVGRSAAPRLAPAPAPAGGIMASLGKSQAKARGISDFFTKDSVKRGFAARLNNAQDAKASLASLQRLRVFLDDAPDDIRRNVRQELNRTAVDADAFIEKLVDPDQFHPAKISDNVLGQSFQNMSVQGRLAGTTFVESNYLELGLERMRGEGTVGANATFSALGAYCGNDFEQMNRALRSPGGANEDLRLKIDLARHALSELPQYQGISIRGAELNGEILARYESGATVTEKAFTSTSADKGFPGNAQFIIESRHGRNVAAVSPNAKFDGTEILFPPNTSFQVLHKEKLGDTTYIVMREAEG